MHEDTTSPTRPTGRRKRLLAACTALGITSTTLLVARPVSALPVTIEATGRVSVTSTGAQGAGASPTWSPLSADGRLVAFTTAAPFDPSDTNDAEDVYLRDRMAGTTTRVSLTDADGQIGASEDAGANVCGMSRDGRFVAFAAYGAGLPVPDVVELYLRDRTLGTTTLVSKASDGAPAGGPGGAAVFGSDRCPVSDDGRYVAFVSAAGNLAPGDANGGASDIYRRDRTTSTTIRVSASAGGTAANGYAGGVAMSANGNIVAFTSDATNLVANDTNGTGDVFVRNVSAGTVVRANLKADGTQVYGGTGSAFVTADGTRVGFTSFSAELVPGGNVSWADAYLKVLATGAVSRLSTTAAGTPIGVSVSFPAMSDDGTTVTFVADLPDGTPNDPNNADDIYVKDLVSGSLHAVSTGPAGSTGNKQSLYPSVSGNGRAVSFLSSASDLVRHDTNGTIDIFVHDLAVDLAPFASTTGLVKQQFADFEGRQPTAAELGEWKARIAYGERTPDQIIDDLAHGTTFAGKRAPMIRLYWAFFLRAPDQAGLDFWTKRLAGGTSLAKVAKQFAASSEFQTKYGSKTNGQFVTLIYQNIFDRDPDPAGLAFWTNRLDQKTKTRGDVMVNFSESSEGKRVLAPQTDTILHFLGMLRTMPSKTYLDLTLGSLKGPWIPQIQVASLRAGNGYAARVTP
jgi:Tol biopolymer transport system component